MVLQRINSVINAALISGFKVDQFGEVSGYPMIGLSKGYDLEKPCVYLSGGIHGDEPASVDSMLTLIKSGLLDQQANWRIAPILNPTGVSAETRENENGIDLNRDFRDSKTAEILSYKRWLERQPPPTLSISLHEDYEAKGFYLYALGPNGIEDLGKSILRCVEKVGPIDHSETIDGRSARQGLILPAPQDVFQEMPDWPEALYLYENHPHNHFTLESPTSLPIGSRIPMHLAAVKQAIASLQV